jgi:hypothetical protein
VNNIEINEDNQLEQNSKSINTNRTYIVVKSRKNGQFTDEKNSKQLYNAFRSLTIINNDTFERCSCWLSSLISTLPIYLIVRFD